jgi:UDP-glucose 4-epimerase
MSQPNKIVVVTGGAGYIGSHVCMKLAEAGFEPFVIDNGVNSEIEAIQWGDYDETNVRNEDEVVSVLGKLRPCAIIHLAGYIEVGESLTETARFYMNNVGGSLVVLCWAQQFEIPVVFSSTCATFGNPKGGGIIDEYHTQIPVNPYGRTKLMVEQAIQDIVLHSTMKATVLRYFNAAGADPEGRIGESHDPETHIIPLVLEAAHTGKPFKVFGTDYESFDGTCIRDYVHVNDLADAHVLAMKRLLSVEGPVYEHFNLGCGSGFSVREVISAVEEETGKKVWIMDCPRRPGDPMKLVADNRKAKDVLGWAPKFGLTDMIRTANKWYLSSK